MLPTFKKIVWAILFVTGWLPLESQAQLGFCAGNSGDPIFTETFGTGTTYGPSLPIGTTSYSFVGGTPNDGSYTISSNTAYFDWFNTQDHTPNDTNGKSFIVNASFTPGEFFRRTVSGLCENTSYEFSSWLMNLHPKSGCNGNGIPINVRFQIWDSTDTNLLASGDTGSIYDKNSPVWEQYALVFQTLPSQTSVILKMLNNGAGGCGNDLAIDDIVFKTCGDFIDVVDDQSNTHILICEDNGPVTTTLSANPDFSIYNTHFYQWQQSSDGSNWVDIFGENGQSYAPQPIISSTFFRIKVAEDAINLNNPLCNTLSEVFDIIIIPKPDPPYTSSTNVMICPNQNVAITVTIPIGISVNWYDAPIGGNLLLENGISFIPNTPGTYYAEAISSSVDCISSTRTGITVDFYDPPMVLDEDLIFCEGSTITLTAGIANMTYLWNTGGTTEEIEVDTPGKYTVVVTNVNGCSSTKTIELKELVTPIIDHIVSDEYTLEIITANSGDFEYSLNGILFQSSNIFPNTHGGLYTLYVRESNGCGIIPRDYIHLVIPKFFTPNSDNINDVFRPEGIEAYSTYEINIFDRYGNLLKSAKNEPFSWDGRSKNKPLPSSDYWYSIKLDSATFKGHFSLKR